MPDRPTPQPSAVFGASTAALIALALSVAVLLLGSVRFARFDWSGLPLARGPVDQERVVSADCTEHIRPYVTSSGRTISPMTVDEQQYMSIVRLMDGTPEADLHISCLLAPFTNRPVMPWLASKLPVDEAVGLGLVNLAMTQIATWAVVFTLRAQGRSARSTALVGTLFAVSWNTLMFGSALLVDSGGVALVALCWLVLAVRRPWLVPVLLLVSYPLKETIALVVLGPLLAWCWGEVKEGRRTRANAAGILAAALVAAVASVPIAHLWSPDSAATWPLSPSLGALINNLLSPIGLVTFVIGVAPLFLPALLVIRDRLRSTSSIETLVDPAVVGVLLTAVLVLWVTMAADLSSRFAWVGTPFAASLAAMWFESGRAGEWLQGLGRRGDAAVT